MVTRLAWILNIQHWNPADLPAEARRWTQSRACLPSSSMCYPRLHTKEQFQGRAMPEAD
ncbi:hypothetical protein BTJ68_10818 [Hortaea werneckii EXF-2000]|uniref:Uncharacterized protein n=1 Tax=Hortaea werneckii EXF-2000 TaxID=1157616 RepID=A0A1Z5SZ56_HORWE|nr:hypothetical protein BTJ68_10818 [Hortaea werneckii EXF-2000]